MKMATDFLFVDHGSICCLTPLSPEAEGWVDDHIPDDAQYFGRAVVIEPRYVEPILEGITEAGLEVA
jgi:hypothetical protein